MDGKGFFLGLIAAVVLFLLWKKEGASFSVNVGPQAGAGPAPVGPQDTLGVGGCAGCGPSASAAPSAQAAMIMGASAGMITPGTPPLQGSLGVGSFYDPNGPTPDTNFWAMPNEAPLSTTAATGSPINYANVPGSPTTPAGQVPVRATQKVAPTSQLGFQQRYAVTGIPRAAGGRQLIM
jgi:hypothetical protein